MLDSSDSMGCWDDGLTILPEIQFVHAYTNLIGSLHTLGPLFATWLIHGLLLSNAIKASLYRQELIQTVSRREFCWLLHRSVSHIFLMLSIATGAIPNPGFSSNEWDAWMHMIVYSLRKTTNYRIVLRKATACETSSQANNILLRLLPSKG